MIEISRHKKTMIAMVHDAFMCLTSLGISFFLAFSGWDKLVKASINYPAVFLVIFSTQVFFLHTSGLYKGIWRYSSTLDLLKLIKGATLGVVFSALFIFFYNRLMFIPRSVFFIDWLMLIVSLGGGRLGYRVIREQFGLMEIAKNYDTRAVIVGAGAAGEQLVRELRRSPHLKVHPVAFVDDDMDKRNKVLHGLSICGGVSDLTQIVKRYEANQVYIAIPTATSKQIDRIVKNCRDTGAEFKTFPHIKDVLNGKISLSQLREVRPEDLLGRDETTLDEKSIRDMITDSSILVTGAGGSIGSELCRQIARFNPKTLILFETCEYNLYQLDLKISEKFSDVKIVKCIGDVRDRERVEEVFKNYSPEVVFHAAAYKHVPMMEVNPKESIKTNIFGTSIVSEFAVKFKVKKFVLVSTDKAVRPTNVMGATKRVAEMVCLEASQNNSCTKFMIVRFGNVLGSSGSVIPLFKKQIKKGGPITVTHPEVTRFFMSIPEACQLVMQAGAFGNGGEVFVLDMGKSVKIIHLAKQMISLSGLTESDIEIKFTGLRPGEKLYEELLSDGENILPTLHPLLKTAKASSNMESFSKKMVNLKESVQSNESDDFVLKKLLSEIVIDYHIYKEKKDNGHQNQVNEDGSISLH